MTNERWRLAPHVGIGGYPTTNRIAGAGGLMLLYGRRHRLVVDVLGGPMAASGATGRRGHYDYGVAFLIGYEWMAHYGLSFRTSIGAAYRPGLDTEPVNVAVNVLSVGYKFW